MNNLILFLLILTASICYAQDGTISKPEYVIVAGDEIVTMEKLNQIDPGRIKGMTKGVSQNVRDSLAEKFGEKVGEREFVILVDLYGKDEKPSQSGAFNTISKAAPNPAKEVKPMLKKGDQAIPFKVLMADGKQMNLADLKGKVVLLNFWATWCAPCLMEFHEIPGKIIDRFDDEEFVFLPIARGEEKELVLKKLEWLENRGVVFNSGIDPTEEIWNKYVSKGIPKNFIIDKNGVIQYVSTGYNEQGVDKIAEEIEMLLEN